MSQKLPELNVWDMSSAKCAFRSYVLRQRAISASGARAAMLHGMAGFYILMGLAKSHKEHNSPKAGELLTAAFDRLNETRGAL